MTREQTSPATTKILVDGVEHEAPVGGRLIEFLHGIGKDIPHFCYHPGLSVAASCRQCQIESKGKGPRPGLVVSCRERIVEGMEILTDSTAAREARRGVMEFLLLNHPLDCPICDKAGECTLQDTAYDTDQAMGRTHEPRRELPKRKSLGETILLDNERCILCTRCVRFFEEVTKEPQLTVTDRGDRSVLTTFMDEPLHGIYQGNIVDLCPVGALTLHKFRFQSRVWFLQETKTICGLCSRGCNTIVETRDGKVFRIRPRYEAAVNGYWMCDEGRLEFDIFNLSEETGRLVEPARADPDGRLKPCTTEEALQAAAEQLCVEGRVLALLSPYATNEEGSAFLDAFGRLAEITGNDFRLGFFQPPSSSKGDDVLRTDEDAPNCRGLAELGLDPLREEELLDVIPECRVVFLTGFGLLALLPASVRIHLKAPEVLLYHGHAPAHLSFAKVALPAATPLEKSGYWVNIDGRSQYIRPALERPSQILADEELFAALLEACCSVLEIEA